MNTKLLAVLALAGVISAANADCPKNGFYVGLNAALNMHRVKNTQDPAGIAEYFKGVIKFDDPDKIPALESTIITKGSGAAASGATYTAKTIFGNFSALGTAVAGTTADAVKAAVDALLLQGFKGSVNWTDAGDEDGEMSLDEIHTNVFKRTKNRMSAEFEVGYQYRFEGKPIIVRAALIGGYGFGSKINTNFGTTGSVSVKEKWNGGLVFNLGGMITEQCELYGIAGAQYTRFDVKGHNSFAKNAIKVVEIANKANDDASPAAPLDNANKVTVDPALKKLADGTTKEHKHKFQFLFGAGFKYSLTEKISMKFEVIQKLNAKLKKASENAGIKTQIGGTTIKCGLSYLF